MADFVNSWKSLQTLWNASKTVLKLFVTAYATFCLHLRLIRNGRKLADFEQKACAFTIYNELYDLQCDFYMKKRAP